jgi:hypothetical protein
LAGEPIPEGRLQAGAIARQELSDLGEKFCGTDQIRRRLRKSVIDNCVR